MSTSPLQPAPGKSRGGGPRTDAGKAASSQNAITFGLFATRDFIRPEEQTIYDQFAESLQNELAPEGILELGLADEIRHAMWRLRRCAQIEEGFSCPEDPMLEETNARRQFSVDRARSQAHRILHKCTAELRKLQTEREYRRSHRDPITDELRLGLCDLRAARRKAEQDRRFEFYSERMAAEAAMDAEFAENLHVKTPNAAASGSSFCTGRPTLVPAQNINRGPK